MSDVNGHGWDAVLPLIRAAGSARGLLACILARCAQQYDVGLDDLAYDSEGLSVRRPVEGAKLTGFEIGDLAPGRAVEGLHPYVRNTIFEDWIPPDPSGSTME